MFVQVHGEGNEQGVGVQEHFEGHAVRHRVVSGDDEDALTCGRAQC